MLQPDRERTNCQVRCRLSSDNTISIVNTFSHVSKVVVEKDNGIYDAINKGIKLATGDIVGILNSDDEFYDNDVIINVSKAFKQNSACKKDKRDQSDKADICLFLCHFSLFCLYLLE